MSEEMARFFLLEILFGIEHLHDKDIVYRDIKP
jgi:serine/threonine protein kinase